MRPTGVCVEIVFSTSVSPRLLEGEIFSLWIVAEVLVGRKSIGGYFWPRDCRVVAPTVEHVIPAPGDVKPNAYTVVDGNIAVREGDNLNARPAMPASGKAGRPR